MVTVSRETFNGWSIDLEAQVEKDTEAKTFIHPDGTTTMTAKPTLGMLQLAAGDQIHLIEIGRTPENWSKHAMVARVDTVELKDRHEDPRRDRARYVRNLILNAERLTGIKAAFVEEKPG